MQLRFNPTDDGEWGSSDCHYFIKVGPDGLFRPTYYENLDDDQVTPLIKTSTFELAVKQCNDHMVQRHSELRDKYLDEIIKRCDLEGVAKIYLTTEYGDSRDDDCLVPVRILKTVIKAAVDTLVQQHLQSNDPQGT